MHMFGEARKALDDRPSIPANVRVHVDDGVAWLTGIVRHSSERAEAEDVVRNVHGIRRIVNKITVVDPGVEGFEWADAGR